MVGQDWKLHLSIPQGPRGGAEAGENRPKKYSAKKKNAPLSGLRSAPLLLRCAEMRFSILPAHRGKDVQLLSTEVRATQQNPRYSGKNNVAIRMIATFMPKYNEIFNYFFCLYDISSVQQILLCQITKEQTIFTTRIISEKSIMTANSSILKC